MPPSCPGAATASQVVRAGGDSDPVGSLPAVALPAPAEAIPSPEPAEPKSDTDAAASKRPQDSTPSGATAFAADVALPPSSSAAPDEKRTGAARVKFN